MKINICIIKPANYIHSCAFLELGELIHFSLKELGFDSTLNFNNYEKNAMNIIIGGHLLNEIDILKLESSTVILNTEQIYGEETPWSQMIFRLAKIFDIWDYSEKNIEKFYSLGIRNVKFFRIGYQKELMRINSSMNKDVDILFYGSLNERRKKILDKLTQHGLEVKILFGVYGKNRDEWIQRSKVVINIHYYNSYIFEVIRVFYLLTNSIAVVGEVNESTSIDPMCQDGIYSAKYDDIFDACVRITENQALIEELQQKAIKAILKYPQKTFTKELVNSYFKT